MEKSTNYNFNLPNSANDEIADINDISDNFRIVDEKIKAEIEKKQDYFADVSDDSQNRDINLNDKNGNVVGQIVVVPTEGIRYTNVLTPESETHGVNKKYVDDTTNNVKSYANNNFANALKGSASSNVVRLTDVSPIEHTLTVKLKNKNLFDISSVVGFQTIRDLTYQSYYGSVSEDKTVTCRYGAYGQGLVLKDWSKYLKAGTYTISADCYYPTTANTVKYEITANLPQFGISSQNQSKTITPDTWTRLSFTVNVASEGNCYLLLQPVGNAGAFYPIDVKFKNIQLEQGSAATSYSPYIADFSTVGITRYGDTAADEPQTYSPTSDGEVSAVTSLYPVTTLISDTDGLIIEAEYNRDINKAFAELQQAILSMGGNA